MPKVHLPDGRVVHFPEGMAEADISKAMEEIAAPKAVEPAAKPEERSLGGFAQNVLTSGGNFIKNTVQGIPTLAKMAGLAGAAYLDPGLATVIGAKGGEAAPKVLNAVAQGAKDRYGNVENIKKTLYEDPVGVAGDVSILAGGAGLGAKAGGAAKIARVLEGVSEATNPMRAVGAVAAPLARGTARTIVKTTLRPPAAVREDFGGAAGVADAVLKNRVFSEASAQKKLAQSVAQADQMLADAQAAGVAGVPRKAVARAVVGEPSQTAALRTRLGVADQRPELVETAKGVLRNNPKEIPLTEAQALKREAQQLAFEAGADNLSVKKAAEIAKAKALRAGIEAQVPEVGPVNQRSQELIGAQRAFQAAEDRPRALTRFLSLLGGVGGGAAGGPVGALAVPLAMQALDSPRLGALAGIGVDTAGRAVGSPMTAQAALIARLLGQENEP